MTMTVFQVRVVAGALVAVPATIPIVAQTAIKRAVRKIRSGREMLRNQEMLWNQRQRNQQVPKQNKKRVSYILGIFAVHVDRSVRVSSNFSFTA